MKLTAANYLKLDRQYGEDCTYEQSTTLLELLEALPKSERAKLNAVWSKMQDEIDAEEEEQYRKEMEAEAHFHAYPE